MSFVKWLLIVGLASYAALVALMYVAQRALMYFPERLHTSPAEAGLPAAEDIVLDTADGERVIVWHLAPRGDEPVVLYFHGNGGALRYRVDRFRALAADGTGLVALSYRGYGGSSGRPTEAGLIADAAAAYAFASSRYPAERLVGKVILEAPFASAVEIGAAAYPFVPVRWLMKDQFRSDLRIEKLTAPVLILHGERDRVVPIASGERLYALVKSSKQFVRFPFGGHEDLAAYGAIETARKFMRGRLECIVL